MDAFELLKTWPGWAKANAESILDSPAWRMSVEWNGEAVELTRADELSGDLIGLDVSLDDETLRLDIADSPAYPDLHRLWMRRSELPMELVLALVEKECGSLFQLLETAFRRQFAVKGLASEGAVRSERTAFRLVAEREEVMFALTLSPVLRAEIGQLKFLDVAHESIATLTRTMVADYGEVRLSPDELDGLKTGDFILLPPESARWTFETDAAEGLRLKGNGPTEFAFAAIAGDSLPSVPEPAELGLFRDGRRIASGTMATVGACAALRIDETV